MSSTDQLPTFWNSIFASGRKRQIRSKNPPGNVSASIVTRQMNAPAPKKITNKVVPSNWRLGSTGGDVITRQSTDEFD
jgi:hypothetical protein